MVTKLDSPVWPAAAPRGVPQRHSQDYWVRLGEARLALLEWQHLDAYIDLSVLDIAPMRGAAHSALLCGGTEWSARHGNTVLSVGWDWVRTHDGALRPYDDAALRTNVRLTDDKGYDLPDGDSLAALWRVIQGWNWQAQVHRSLTDCWTPGSDQPLRVQ